MTKHLTPFIAILSCFFILLHLVLRYICHFSGPPLELPLLITLFLGGPPLIIGVIKKLFRREYGADILAAISIIVSVALHEYLAGAIVVLMLSGGKTLEDYAVKNASSVLNALAKRMPTVAHRRQDSKITDVRVDQILVDDTLVVYPHEICPVDGTVIEGHGTMNEAYLTGEPFQVDKAPGSSVISGAINGDALLAIKATRVASDSRYAKIMEVMQDSEKNKPQIRRLGDQVGTLYAPLALTVAGITWLVTQDATRFLSVLVVATPCPLLIAIPVAIIGSISLAARRGIIIKNAAILERITTCKTAIFDKTGTLTHGEPFLSTVICAPSFIENDVLSLAASLERYSKHPLALAVTAAAKKNKVVIHEALEVHEIPGEGLKGAVAGKSVRVLGRGLLKGKKFRGLENLPAVTVGLECVVVIDETYAATLQFRDKPRAESQSFIHHLEPSHNLTRSIIVSGDRESEVRYLADQVGIKEIYAEKNPEEKLAIVRSETNKAATIYVGDGINDAPALMSATVGIAIGRHSDITSQAAGAVILDSSLIKVDELIHIGGRMRAIALQSALGGMVLCLVAMGFAASGYLSPVAGALVQEGIDLLAILNALRAAWPPRELSDVTQPSL